ncbi:MAG: nuclear transport factor 2 family protein [Rhodanobacteraceae bacterium]
MMKRIASMTIVGLTLSAFSGAALAETWNAQQQQIWNFEQQQWKASAAKDQTWIDTMVHPNLRYWDTGMPMPRDQASLKHWNRYDSENNTVLEQELFPISITITDNIAVVQYDYTVARENYKKERETVNGHYTDVLIKDGKDWKFIAWAGGDDPKK